MASTQEPTNPNARDIAGPMLPIEQEIARGFRFTHLVLMALERQSKETVGLTDALNKLLIAKGITSDTEWNNAVAKCADDNYK